MDKSREQFEAWVLVENERRIRPDHEPLQRNHHGYRYGWVFGAWEVWQASRAAIEVELPDTDKHDAVWLYEVAVKNSLDHSGVKYK